MEEFSDSQTAGVSVTNPAVGGTYGTLSAGEVTMTWETTIGRFDSSFFEKLTRFLKASAKSSSLLSCNRQRGDLCLALFVSRERRVCSLSGSLQGQAKALHPEEERCEPYLQGLTKRRRILLSKC